MTLCPHLSSEFVVGFFFHSLGSVTFEAVVIIDDVSDEEAVNQVAPALQNLAQTNFTIYNETTEVSYYIVNVIEGMIAVQSLQTH